MQKLTLSLNFKLWPFCVESVCLLVVCTSWVECYLISMLFGTLRYIFVKFLCLFNNIQSMRGIIIIIMGVKEQGGKHSAMEATQRRQRLQYESY